MGWWFGRSGGTPTAGVANTKSTTKKSSSSSSSSGGSSWSGIPLPSGAKTEGTIDGSNPFESDSSSGGSSSSSSSSSGGGGSSSSGSYNGIPLPSGTTTEGTLDGSSPFDGSSSLGGISSSVGGSSLGSSSSQSRLTPPPKTDTIKVLSGGGVMVGTTEFIGEVIVPGTLGKTANQIQNEWWKEARKQGITKKGTYSVNLPFDYYFRGSGIPTTTTKEEKPTTAEKLRARLNPIVNVGTGVISTDTGKEFEPYTSNNFFKEMGHSVSTIFSAIKGERTWKDVYMPKLGKKKEETTAYTTLGFKKTFPFVTAKETTYGDLIKIEREKTVTENPDISKQVYMSPQRGLQSLATDINIDISKDFQDKINAGANFEQMQIEANLEAGKRYEEQSKPLIDFYEKTSKYGNLKERYSEGLIKVAPAVIETTALVGLGTLGGPMGIGASASWLGYRGALQIKKTQEETPAMSFARFKGVTLGATSMGLGIAGAGMATKALERQIVQGQFEELGAKQWDFLEIKKAGANREPFQLVATRTHGDLQQSLLSQGNVLKIGKQGYIAPKTQVLVTTQGKLDWNIMSGGKGTGVMDTQTFITSSRGISIPMNTKTSISVGETLTQPMYSTGGVMEVGTPTSKFSKVIEKSFKVSKEPTQVSFNLGISEQIKPNVYFSKGYQFKGIDMVTSGGTKSVNIIAPQTSRGFTFILPESSTGGKGAVSIISSKGGSASQQSLQNLYATNIASSLSKVTPTIKSGSVILTNPLTIGTGTETTAKASLISKNIISPTITLNKLASRTQTSTSQIPIVNTIVKDISKGKTKGKTKQTPISIVNLDLLQTPTQAPALSSAIKGLTKQQSKLSQTSPTITPIGFSSGISMPTIPLTFTPIFPIAFPKGAPFKFSGSKTIGGKRKYSYAPSYKAIAFGITSKKQTPISTKKWTGLETRPFTKGFSFFKVRDFLKKKKKRGK